MSTFFHLPPVGEEVRLLTHLVVREDAHILYAFATEGERRLFRSFDQGLRCGAKIALACCRESRRKRSRDASLTRTLRR